MVPCLNIGYTKNIADLSSAELWFAPLRKKDKDSRN